MADDLTQDPTAVSTQESAGGAGDPTPDPSGAIQDPSWTKDQQAAYTKKTQELSEAHKKTVSAFESERNEWQTQRKAAEEQILAQYRAVQQAQQQQQYQQPQGQQPVDLLEQVQGMDFLDGKTAHKLAQQLQSGITPVAQAYQQVQKQNQWLYQQLGAVQKTLAGLQGSKNETDFNGLLTRTRSELGLPDNEMVTEAMRDVYLSHQDDKDLQANFSSMVSARMEGLRKAFFDAANAKAKAARTSPFANLSQGSVSPSGPSKVGYRDPEQMADELWPLIEEKGPSE